LQEKESKQYTSNFVSGPFQQRNSQPQ